VTASFSKIKILKATKAFFPSGIRMGKFISVYNVTLSSVLRLKNQRILNFRVMVLRDTNLQSHLMIYGKVLLYLLSLDF